MPFLPFIPFADCVEIALTGVYGLHIIVNTFACQKAGPITPTDLSAIGGVFDNWWQTNLRGSVSVNYTLDTIKMTDLTSVAGPTLSIPPSANPSGAATGTSVPNNVAVVTSAYTALRGRSYRGRSYLAAIPSSSLFSSEEITTTAQAAIQAAYDQLQTDLLTGGYTPVVLSRYNAGVRRTIGVPTPLVNFVTKRRMGTIRNRIS
jgi:hypothetical protein